MARRFRITLEHLRVLDAIERHGSFAAASQELCVVTSAITHTVRHLEEQLGLTLFDRSGRRVRFTREGATLLERGRTLLASAGAFDEAVRLLATGWEASLEIVVDQVLGLQPLVPLAQGFFEVAPDTSLHLRREAASGSWDALLSGRADLVIGAPADGPGGGGYECMPLGDIRFVAVVAPGHPLARRADRVADRELAEHRAVILGDTSRRLPQLPLSLVDHRRVLSVPDEDSKLAALLSGVGVGFLPEPMARSHLLAGALVMLEVQKVHPPSRSTIAWRAGENGRALRWWIDRLREPRWRKALLGDAAAQVASRANAAGARGARKRRA